MKARRSKGRVLWTTFAATLFAVGIVLFPLSGRGAGSADAGASSTHGTATSAGGGHTSVGATTKEAKKAGGHGGKAAHAEPEAEAEPTKEPAKAAEPAGKVAPEAEEDLTSIPVGKGLPVRVNVGVFFLELESFDDTKGEWEATIDIRYAWNDQRLAYDKKQTLRGYREFLGKAAEAQLEKIWTPTVDVKNRVEAGEYTGRRLRIYPDGRVETITRTSGKYKSHVDAGSFPFDRQKLGVELIVRDQTLDFVRLRFDEHDVAFSRPAGNAKLDGWDLGIVDLSRSAVAGWNGDRYGTVTATLFVDRRPGSSLASVFIPLLASLLIPLLALWMNQTSEDGFAVDAFELANMGIGGLFSVIALSFAIYSSNPIIASGDNTVTRLFALNYASLAISLGIVVAFFRFELPKKLFGRYVQEESFHFLSWAIPLLAMATSLAFLLVAAA